MLTNDSIKSSALFMASKSFLDALSKDLSSNLRIKTIEYSAKFAFLFLIIWCLFRSASDFSNSDNISCDTDVNSEISDGKNGRIGMFALAKKVDNVQLVMR